jgi:uncharacterized protein YbaR (Trm112 family)
MPVDGKLLEIICCPVSRTPLTRLEASRLERLNREIEAGKARFIGGDPVDKPLEEALVTEDGKVIYPVNEGIPVLLEERGIGTTQFQDF